ncbi:MAG: sodium ion-translocating decarboxylase subunit beta [Ruminococcaceae bacterium]|nr:sodium ion-translocating decarboxylase subunit beta [Oscillospiraceae bacterium]
MKKLYERYKKLKIDYAALGLEMREEEEKYFCTPKGAKIIGWSGVDGIHFCFVRGFGEMVFSVNPMGGQEEYVHPVAESFEKFLRLLVTCGTVDAVEQAYGMTKEQFAAYTEENKPTEKQREYLKRITEVLNIEPMAESTEAYVHIKEIQKKFDYSKIKYTEDYGLWVPPRREFAAWKVYFGEGFWGKNRSRPGEEHPVGQAFVWNEERWHIPSVYVCAKGLVVDICVEVPFEKVERFMRQWNLTEESEIEDFSEEESQRIERENPLNIGVDAEIIVNGRRIEREFGVQAVWNPCLPEGCTNDREVQALMEHYDCDAESGWVFMRRSFPWATTRKPQIRTVELRLKGERVSFPAGHLVLKKAGDRAEVIHPITGEKYELTVQELTDSEMNMARVTEVMGEEVEYPIHYKMMMYTVSPEIKEEELRISDSKRSDSPRQRKKALYLPQATSCAVIGIIGGADGPTALILGGPAVTGKLHAACSGLRFEPVETVDWKAEFRVNLRGERSITLLEE